MVEYFPETSGPLTVNWTKITSVGNIMVGKSSGLKSRNLKNVISVYFIFDQQTDSLRSQYI